MTIKSLTSDTIKKLVADIKRVDKAAERIKLEGLAHQALASSEKAVLSKARPEIDDINAAQQLSGQLTKKISNDSSKAVDAVGQLDKNRVDSLLED